MCIAHWLGVAAFMHVLLLQVEGVSATDVKQLSRQLQQLSQQFNQVMQQQQRQLNQVLAHAGKGSDSNMVLAHHMGQMRDVQVGVTGMMMEVYRNQMQSGGTIRFGGVPLPSREVANVSEQGLPKAVQARLRKERKLREKQRQQQEEGVKARKQALKDQMPGQHSCTESAEKLAEEAPCPSADDTYAATSADMQSVCTSDATEPLSPDQAAPCHELLIPGKGRLAWTEWLGKRVGISGINFNTCTMLHHLYMNPVQ